MNKSKLRNLLCITMLFLICSVILKAQTPKFINYQGLARDASGNPITNQSVALGFTITNGSSAPFTDSKNATTNTFGLFNTTIGSSSNPINSNLSFGSYSLIVSINSSVLPPQLLASVPYALNAPEPTVTYTSGVLSIGSSTVAINSASYQAGNGISISSGSIINTAPSQTININTTNTVLTVNSAYPSYSINMASQVFSASTNTIISSYGGSFVIPTSTSSILNGDVTGPSNSNTVIALRNISLAVTPPTSGQRLTYNGSTWNYVTPPFSISGNTITPSNLAHGLAIGTNSLTFGGNNYSLAVTGAQYLDGFFNQNGMLPPSLSGTGNGRIYFNSLLNKFMVSEGGNSYVPLLPTNIWTITGTAIYPTTLTNNVGLGTNSPTSKLEVVETNSTIATKISSSGAAHALEVTNSNSNNVYYAGNFKGGVNIISKSGPTDYGLLVRDNLLNSVFNVQNNGNVGIGTPAPIKKLDVIGDTKTDNLQITNGAIVNSVLTATDALGNSKWVAPVIFQFEFAPTAAISITTNTVNNLGNNIQFTNTQSVAIGGGFNPSNARFTAPTAGQYEFNASLYVILNPSTTGNNWIYLDICKNPASPVILRRCRMNNQDGGSISTYVTMHANVITTLAVGDVVFLRAVGGSGGTGGSITNLNSPELMNSFNGKLLR